MLKNLSKDLLKSRAPYWITDEGLKRHGIGKLMTCAKLYNRWVYADKCRQHDEAFQNQRDELLRENAGGDYNSSIALRDGWAIDTSMSLPYLEELLREASEIVDARGGRRHSDIQQPFLRNLLFPGDLERYPSLVNFITSSEILSCVMDYMKTVPVLSMTRPPGVRFMESNQNLDPGAYDAPRASQLYHLDIHDTPLVYVLVAVQDITPTSGPWTFLPAAASARATKALGYRGAGVDYRVTDEKMYEIVDRNEAIAFAYPKGSVLFIDSSRCFHYGSRNSRPPRYQLMYGLSSVSRCDFSQTFMSSIRFPLGPTPSRLRRLVCK